MRLIQAPTPDSHPTVPRHRRVLGIVGDTQVGLWVLRSLGPGGLQVYCICSEPSAAWPPAAASRPARGGSRSVRTTHGFVDDIVTLARQLDVGSDPDHRRAVTTRR